MEPKYKIGQNVIVKPIKDQPQSARDSDIGQYAGQRGKVTNYHWVSPRSGEVFYIYTVQFGEGEKEVVLHEDELEVDTARTRRRFGLNG